MGMNLQGEAGTEEKCAFACAHATDVYVGRGVFVCERGVHIPASCPCVWIWSGCSLPAVFPHPFFPSHSRASVPGREDEKTCGGERNGAGGRGPAYQLPAADWSQLMQGSHPKYDRLNICFGLVSLFW